MEFRFAEYRSRRKVRNAPLQCGCDCHICLQSHGTVQPDEALSSLDKAPCQHTIAAKNLGVSLIHSAEPSGLFRFSRKIYHFRSLGLHPIGHFVVLDARLQVCVGLPPLNVLFIQLVDTRREKVKMP